MADQPTITHPEPPQPDSNKAVKIIIILLVVLFALGVAGGLIGYFLTKKAADEIAENTEEAGELVQEIQQYPDSYLQAELPQYPEATVTHLGRKDAKPSEGSVVIVVTTTDELEAVGDFFDEKLEATGWQQTPDSAANQPALISRSYTKGKQEFNLLIQRNNQNTTNATITWAENS